MQEVNFEPLQQVQHLIRSLERIKEHGDEHPKHGDSTREKHSGIRFFGGLLIQHPRAWRTLDGFSAHTCDACCFRNPVFEDNRSESLVLVFFGPVANKQKWATRNSHSPVAENWASSFVLAHTHTRTHAHTHTTTLVTTLTKELCVCVCVYSLCQCTHAYQVELNAKTNFSRSSNSWITTRTNHLFKFHVTSQQESLPDTGLEKYWNMTK